jgi:hypothetical protein
VWHNFEQEDDDHFSITNSNNERSFLQASITAGNKSDAGLLDLMGHLSNVWQWNTNPSSLYSGLFRHTTYNNSYNRQRRIPGAELATIHCLCRWRTRYVRIGTNPWVFRPKVDDESCSSFLFTEYLTAWLPLRRVCKKQIKNQIITDGDDLEASWQKCESTLIQTCFSLCPPTRQQDWNME